MKQCLVYDSTEVDHITFIKPWIRPVVEKYFDLEVYDPEKTYSQHKHIVLITHASHFSQPYLLGKLWINGFRTVIDHLWDSDVEKLSHVGRGGKLILHCPNFMWYYSNLEFKYLGHEAYIPNRNPTHSFLTLMNNARWHRDQICNVLESILNTAKYSYAQRNIYIDDDSSPDPELTPDHKNWSRFLNPEWYNSTAFSVVAESYMRNTKNNIGMRTEVSEKIFKPLAYQHPFVVYGSVDTLKYLKEQGFETFDNIFNESYDSILDDDQRFAAVSQQVFHGVDCWRRGWTVSAETQRRLQHNTDHFYNENILQRFEKEIINPILEFVNDAGSTGQ